MKTVINSVKSSGSGNLTGSGKERLFYIDNLRLLMIVFVVIMHLAVTYSGMGSWYVTEGKAIGIVSKVIFGFYQSFTQGYFMGLLFLISGYFVPAACDKKGPGRFIKDRLYRLGIPTLIYMLIINPFILYVLLDLYWVRPKPDFFSYYAGYITSLDFIKGSGPLWFAFALLIFSVVYGLIRLIGGKKEHVTPRGIKPSFKNCVILILLIAVCAFLIRLIQPIGTNIINMQLCYFSQYIILFIVGIKGGRDKLFTRIDYKSGKRWFITALAAGFVFWVAIMLLGGAANGDGSYCGGLNWQAAAYALWESFAAVAMAVGLIAVFRQKHNRQGRLVKTLSDNSFAVYLFHAPIIIAAALLFKPVNLPQIVKFLILCLVCIPLCFVFTHFIARRIPLLKKVL